LAFRRPRILNDVEQIRVCLDGLRGVVVPEQKDLAAIAWFLGAVYNEVEEVLKAVAKRFGELVIANVAWHQELLARMAQANEIGPAIMTVGLRDRLGELLAFRHVSRHATALDLDWERMRPVAEAAGDTIREFLAALEAFLST
jgi:hypothetical protein